MELPRIEVVGLYAGLVKVLGLHEGVKVTVRYQGSEFRAWVVSVLPVIGYIVYRRVNGVPGHDLGSLRITSRSPNLPHWYTLGWSHIDPPGNREADEGVPCCEDRSAAQRSGVRRLGGVRSEEERSGDRSYVQLHFEE